MINKILIILLTTIAISLIGCAWNCSANNNLSGTLYVSGNEPFTHLALHSNDDNYYKIECSDSLKKELWQLQGKIIELDIEELKEFDKLNIAIVKGYSIMETE